LLLLMTGGTALCATACPLPCPGKASAVPSRRWTGHHHGGHGHCKEHDHSLRRPCRAVQEVASAEELNGGTTPHATVRGAATAPATAAVPSRGTVAPPRLLHRHLHVKEVTVGTVRCTTVRGTALCRRYCLIQELDGSTTYRTTVRGAATVSVSAAVPSRSWTAAPHAAFPRGARPRTPLPPPHPGDGCRRE
jgi:hypothetical protein